MARRLISAVAAVLAVVCILPAITFAARDMVAAKKAFVVEGRVFCDTCRAGFETPLSTYIQGAKVRVECRLKATGEKTCSFEGTTDHTGTYNILVADEHEHETCQAVVVSSPIIGCKAVLQVARRLPCSSATTMALLQTPDMLMHLASRRTLPCHSVPSC